MSRVVRSQILQMAAALEDPNEFIMTLMLRYGIHFWLAPDFESVMRRVRLTADAHGGWGVGKEGRNGCVSRDDRKEEGEGDVPAVDRLTLWRALERKAWC